MYTQIPIYCSQTKGKGKRIKVEKIGDRGTYATVVEEMDKKREGKIRQEREREEKGKSIEKERGQKQREREETERRQTRERKRRDREKRQTRERKGRDREKRQKRERKGREREKRQTGKDESQRKCNFFNSILVKKRQLNQRNNERVLINMKSKKDIGRVK